MKRIQLFEFEDQSWFPTWLRTCLTNLLKVLHGILGIGDVLTSLIAKVLKEQKLSQVVDLGSGSGGSMPEVLESLHQEKGLENVKLIMTDLYPNKDYIKRYNDQNNPHLQYREASLDATHFENAPEGLKTMVNSFHHMPPKQARGILESAHKNKQPILIYEMAENKIPTLIWALLLPLSLVITMLMAIFLTFRVRPLTWQQVVFTIIPIIPITYAWDGQASLPRMYAFKDLEKLLEGLQTDDYKWEMGNAKKKNGKKLGTYLIGTPVRSIKENP